jgi:hypothetical protein
LAEVDFAISAALAAWVFAALIAILAFFQLGLAAGLPWGAIAMGGRFPGRFPPAMRVAAVVQILIYGVMAAVVFARAGLALPDVAGVERIAIWAVVALNVVALMMNLITPSRLERRIWAPVALVLLLASVRVALG